MASPEPIAGRCGAKVRPKPEQGREGGYCTRPPSRGQARCRAHGGSTPQAKAAAERRLAEQGAQAVVHKYGMPIEVHPADAILDTIARLNGACVALRDVITELEPRALVWGKKEVTKIGSTQFPGVDKTFAAGINPFVELYERNLRELARLSVDALKVDVMLKREQRDAQMGDFMITTLLRFAELLGHDVADDRVLALVDTALAGPKPLALEA